MAIKTVEPSEFIAGDSVRFIKELPDYLPEAGWALTYVFINQRERYTVAATDSGDGKHDVELTPTVTGDYSAGEYKVHGYVTDGTDRHTIYAGSLVIQPNYTNPSYDPRSHVKKVLDAVQAVIEEKATEDQQAVTINGRSITLYSIPDLLKLRDKYKAEYAEEKKRERIKKGLGHRGKIQARFR